MKHALLVSLGGLVGSLARYKLGGVILHHSVNWRFPLSTFSVNIIGCFVFGVLAGLGEKHLFLSADTRLFLFTGLLGGFTTFSAFGADGVNLLRRGDVALALAYAFLSVAGGFAALWIGMKLCGVATRVS